MNSEGEEKKALSFYKVHESALFTSKSNEIGCNQKKCSYVGSFIESLNRLIFLLSWWDFECQIINSALHIFHKSGPLKNHMV